MCAHFNVMIFNLPVSNYYCFVNQCTDGSAFFLSSLFQKSLGKVRPRFPGENFGDSFMTYIDQLMMPK